MRRSESTGLKSSPFGSGGRSSHYKEGNVVSLFETQEGATPKGEREFPLEILYRVLYRKKEAAANVVGDSIKGRDRELGRIQSLIRFVISHVEVRASIHQFRLEPVRTSTTGITRDCQQER